MLTDLQEQQLKLLIEEGKEKGYVSVKKILELVDEDSEEYDEFVRVIDEEGIEITEKSIEDEVNSDLDDLDSDELFEEDLKEDPEFADLSNEIENDLKTKDIDDIVSSIVSSGFNESSTYMTGNKGDALETFNLPLLNAKHHPE